MCTTSPAGRPRGRRMGVYTEKSKMAASYSPAASSRVAARA
jgi:hypothetical protein